jgi:predicted transcriptional regulator
MNDSTPGVEGSFQGFTFFTNYAHVLFLIAKTSDVRMRELASEIGITERAVQRIVDDLTNSGYLSITKEGRRNRYSVKADLSLKHPLAQHRSVGEFFRFIHSEP